VEVKVPFTSSMYEH